MHVAAPTSVPYTLPPDRLLNVLIHGWQYLIAATLASCRRSSTPLTALPGDAVSGRRDALTALAAMVTRLRPPERGTGEAMAARLPQEVVRTPMVRQGWCESSFVHWSYDPAAIQASLPTGLTVD